MHTDFFDFRATLGSRNLAARSDGRPHFVHSVVFCVEQAKKKNVTLDSHERSRRFDQTDLNSILSAYAL